MSRQLPQPLSVPAPQFDVVNHPVKDTLVIVSTLLSILVQKNDSHYDPMRDPVTLFHSRAVPRISIEAYLIRVLQYIPFTNEVLLNVLVFLDRIGGLEGMQLQKGGTLTSTANPSSKTTGTTTTMTKLMESSAKDPEIYRSESPNSDISLPVIQKRGRSDQEDVVERSDYNNSNNNMKRARTESVSSTSSSLSSSSVSVVAPSTPVSTPPTPSLPLPSSNGFRINSFNIHRLLITCLMVAAKFTSDLFYSNARYAKVGGLSLPELNQLELEFLFTTKFELNVKVDELQRVGNALLQFRDRHMVRAVQQQQQQLQQQHQQQQQQLRLQMQMQMQMQYQQHCMPYATPSPTSPNSISSEVVSVPVQASTVHRLASQEQKTQLLSPPEEKHSWAESEVHETHAQRIDEHLQY
ncbi:hypothetical protein BGX26_003342 [Mortierella sp. AD094]|nr:hypothetical protein BGX26_003342 [Mortierella sp. AD094]